MTAQQGMHLGLTGNHDALIVDRGLAVMDGADLIALLRARGITAPALILTARGSVEDRVEGLDAGAQDYLVKPFEVPELLARVRALLRRADDAATVLQSGGLRLDLMTRRVRGADVGDVELTERECALLATLMRTPRSVFTRPQLLTRAFQGVESEAAVDLYVHYLRRKLGKKVVRTVHGSGYRFGLESTPDRASVPHGDLAVVRRAGRMVALQTSAALAAVLVLVGLVVAAVYDRSQSRQIDDELTTVAMSADDATDPPPGMELAFRDAAGTVSTSDGGEVGVPLLSGPAGFTDLREPHRSYRAMVADRPEGRVVALMDLAPYRASRSRLLGALTLAELTGIVASIAVVVLFTRRSVRPLAQALALQRRFVADASHELRTPLTVLHTRAQVLAGRLHAGDLSAGTRDADALVGDTRNLGDIVDDLLASATMSPARNRGDRVDVGRLGQSVCASMQAHAESIGVGLGCTTGGDDLAVTGSEAALRRALTALIDNALGHQNDGGTVHVDIRRDGRKIIVAVVDDGVGVDRATMATLFNRFSRGTARPNRGGRRSYGIGLSLVREIVDAHGGHITVSSAPDRGATFTLTLPAA